MQSLKTGLGLDDLVDLDLVRVVAEHPVGPAQRVPHHDEVGLAGAAGGRGHRQIDPVGAGLEGRLIGADGDARGLVRVQPDVDVVAEASAGPA